MSALSVGVGSLYRITVYRQQRWSGQSSAHGGGSFHGEADAGGREWCVTALFELMRDRIRLGYVTIVSGGDAAIALVHADPCAARRPDAGRPATGGEEMRFAPVRIHAGNSKIVFSPVRYCIILVILCLT